MSVSPILTQGVGSFGSVNYLPTLGFNTGVTTPVVSAVIQFHIDFTSVIDTAVNFTVVIIRSSIQFTYVVDTSLQFANVRPYSVQYAKVQEQAKTFSEL